MNTPQPDSPTPEPNTVQIFLARQHIRPRRMRSSYGHSALQLIAAAAAAAIYATPPTEQGKPKPDGK